MKFIQLTKPDCTYLLNLITEIDNDIPYTQKQRSYTVPKLQHIAEDPDSHRLAYQDVEYLLELLEDDPVETTEKDSARLKLLEIQKLQAAHFAIEQDIAQQRAARRAKRVVA